MSHRLGYQFDAGKEEIADRLLQYLEGICVSRTLAELIGAAAP